jgi:Carboxypeptidase regulatory-like domain
MRLGCVASTLAAFLTLSVPASSRAQPPPTPQLATGTGLIVGQVIDGATGKGVSSAVVTLASARRVMTTSDGRFVFRNLPEGSHNLTASKSGYIDGGFGARRPGGPTLPVVLADGERRGDLIIRLWRHGSISGVISDEAGEPLVGIQVTALRRSMVGGRRRFTPGGTGTTDDRGLYRISRLSPGDYIVGMVSSQISLPASTTQQLQEVMMAGAEAARSAMLQTIFQIGGTPLMAGGPDSRQVGDQVQTIPRNTPTPPPVDGPRLFAYPTTLYPAAPVPAAATIVSVGSAQERTGVDIQVRPIPTARVSGTVSGAPTTAANVGVRLVPLGADDLGRTADAAATLTDAGGAFTFPAVPAGEYTLRVLQTPRAVVPPSAPMMISVGSGVTMGFAGGPPEGPPPIPSEPTLWAVLPVAVGETDVSGVNVVLRTGLRISGRVEFDGTAEKPTPEQLQRIFVLIEPVDGQIDRMATPPGRIDARGQFNTSGFATGRYFVRIPGPPAGWSLKGVFVGDRDVSDVPLELESSDVSDVVVTFTDRSSSISGTVQVSERDARDGVAVIVFPADSKLWQETGANPRRMRRMGVSDSGAYVVGSLPPGEYFVAAIREVTADWQDPKFLEQLSASAAHVQLDDGEKATQNLRVQEIK